MSPSTKKLLRLLVESAAPRDDWRKAFRLTLAQLRQDVDLHPAGGSAAEVFDAAAHVPYVALAVLALSALVLNTAVGLLVGRRVSGHTPLSILREE